MRSAMSPQSGPAVLVVDLRGVSAVDPASLARAYSMRFERSAAQA